MTHPILTATSRIDEALTSVADTNPTFMPTADKAEALKELVRIESRVRSCGCGSSRTQRTWPRTPVRVTRRAGSPTPPTRDSRMPVQTSGLRPRSTAAGRPSVPRSAKDGSTPHRRG
jgi:hypothetical protein